MISAFNHDPTIDLVNRVGECAMMYPEERPIIVGVAGGSGSGKTTIARHLLESLGAEQITYIPHDK
jgi:pantothenate kinase-related protein Tda10